MLYCVARYASRSKIGNQSVSIKVVLNVGSAKDSRLHLRDIATLASLNSRAVTLATNRIKARAGANFTSFPNETMSDTRSRGTIEPAANFNAEKVASRLRRAMRGIGTDEKVIIDVLTSHSNSQRQVIKKKYKVMYGMSLEEDIKAELGGHFEDVCLALLTPVAEFIVECLHAAVKELRYLKTVFREAGLSKSWGSDQDLFITVLATRSREQLRATIAAYENVAGHIMEEAIKSGMGWQRKACFL
ncbi:annexin-B12 [Trichonephila inaurata madagascariensis]|uniref:Annexin-B12 n=1 Tax=Trichonephila inaurata madagascariensis TaxID=2747483 RepID=A0A8X6J304_9ARAC|nr:annexin-B12 [Trichonephila inaurata madagascariensis]